MATTTRPVQNFRFGRIKVAIWANTGQDQRVYHRVTAQRLYKTEEHGWQSTASFSRDDLPLLAKALDRAHTWIYEQKHAAATEA